MWCGALLIALLLFVNLQRITTEGETVVEGEEPTGIVSSSSDIKVMEGDSVLLPCKTHNIGSQVRIWKQLPSRFLFSGNVVVSRDPHIRLQEGGTGALMIANVTTEYEGQYMCQISHSPHLGVVHRIRVLVPPTIMPDPPGGKVVARKGQPSTIHCNVTGNPMPVLTWTYERDGLKSSAMPGGVRHSGTQLHIPSADVDHAGIFGCTADNDVGDPVTATFNLKVLFAPEVTVEPDWVHGDDGATADFRCESRSNPPSHVTWERGEGKVLVGDGERVILRQKITPPNLVEAWLRVQRMRREDLGPYRCKAKNSVGENSKIAEISGLAEPASLKGKPSGEASFSLLWTTRSYSPVLEYQLKIRRHRSSEPWTDVVIPADPEGGQSLYFSQQYEVTGIEPGVRYEAVLQAHNDFGWNRPSDTFLFGEEPTPTLPMEEPESEAPLPLYDAELDVTDPTSLKQELSAASRTLSWSYCFVLLLLLRIVHLC